MSTATPSSPPTRYRIVIEAGSTEKNYWRDLWRYRELFYILAWRDIAVRYKQTAIGIAWAVIQPLAAMLVLTFAFGKAAGLAESEPDTPYSLVVYTGLLPWLFFATALTYSSQSLVTNANLLSKVYFPRLVVPTAAIVVALIDFLISCVIFAGLLVYHQYLPPARAFMLPVFVMIAFLAAMSVGLWISALNVKYRDFRYIVPFIVQFGLFISPVGFSQKLVPEQYRLLYSLNPMVGVIDGFRWCLLNDSRELYIPGLVLSVILIALLLASGIWYFRRMERTFADII